MSRNVIRNSLELEFVAYLSMHLENLFCEQNKSNNTKQRDRYTQLIAFIKESSFESANEKYIKSPWQIIDFRFVIF